MIKKAFFIFLIILILIFTILSNKTNDSDVNSNDSDIDTETIENNDFVSYNGWLHTSNSSIVNQYDEKVQLKGLSSHGIQWFSDVITYDNLKILKENWNINVFRIALYTDPNSSGYISNPQELKEKVYQITDWAIDLDMYVIIDWHILEDNNPLEYKEEAKLFFDEISKKYADTPNVIYEICNEPNR